MIAVTNAIIIEHSWRQTDDGQDADPLLAYVYEDDLLILQSLDHGSLPRVLLNKEELLQLLALFPGEPETMVLEPPVEAP